ncbi:uncharacterized protein LOC123885701 isoform X2 [Trifolium pratense]|uniref:uncharacterized protein LOC123885701 isoform X2 n=1 Tax=Trifolium pratense TaxID=57577 RepID=UPI001E6922F5|nr:uncharacterized protein LOC123885701 isoform X2 [Trifolium pratense]
MVGNGYDQCIVRRFRPLVDLAKIRKSLTLPSLLAVLHLFHSLTITKFQSSIKSFHFKLGSSLEPRLAKGITSLKEARKRRIVRERICLEACRVGDPCFVCDK